jgi:hypothetical protein
MKYVRHGMICLGLLFYVRSITLASNLQVWVPLKPLLHLATVRFRETHMPKPGANSYYFEIYYCNASVVVGKSVFTEWKNTFYSKNALPY